MNANDLMLFAGLGVILFIVIMGIIGFCVGGKREFVWITILLLLLGIVWIGFGNVDKILAADISNYSNTINQLVGANYDINTLWDFILQFVKENVTNADILFVEGSNAYQALYDIVSCVLRAALLIVGTLSVIILILLARFITLIVRMIVGLISLIVRLISGKRRPKEPKTMVKQPVIEENVTVTHDNNNNSSNAIVTVEKQPTTYKRKPKLRWWGAGVGITKAILILLLIFIPISGVITIASSVSSDSLKAVNEFMYGQSDRSEQQVADTNSAIDQVYEYIYAYQDSFLGKFMDFSSFFFEDDLSNMMFEDLLTVKLDGHKIVIPREVILYIEVVNKLAPMYQNGEIKLYDYAIEHPEDMDEAFGLLKQSKLVPAIVPIGIEYASTIQSLRDQLANAGFSEEDINNIFATFVDVDWYQDWELLCDILRDGIVIGDFFAEEIDILAFNSEPLRRALTNLGTTRFVNEIMPVVFKFALSLDQVKNFVGEDFEVSVDGINWAAELANFADMYECFVKLGIGINDFANLDLEYLQTLLKDQEKCDAVVELLGYLIGAPNGEIDEDINLFAQVIVPIADAVVNKQLIDNSLEMFADIISLSGAQYAEQPDFDVKKMWEHDLEAIVKIAHLASEINALSLKVEEMKLDDVKSLKAIVDELFSLQLIGGSVEYKGRFEDLKTALLEAAIDKFEFLLPGSDWSKVDWNIEKENIKGLIDVFGQILELNDQLKEELNLEEDVIDLATFKINWDALLQDKEGRFIDLVIKAVEVFFDDETPSELFLTAIPNAVNKYLMPKLNEIDSELGELPLFDGLTSDEIREEVINFIEIFKDVAALKITTDSPQYSAKVGKEGKYALSDIIQRIIQSKLLVYTGGEEIQDYRGRIIRIVLKLATNIEIDTHDLDSTLIGGPIDYEADLNKIDDLVTALIEEVIADDGALNEVLFEDGELKFNMDKFLEFVLDSAKVNGVINALEAIFGKYDLHDENLNTTPATLLSALLPGIYYGYLETAIPEEFRPILDIKHFKYNQDGIFTGADLANDIAKLLYALHKAVDLGAIDIYNGGKITESQYEITDKTIEGIREILNILPEIKIFQEKFADVIDITLGLMNVNISSEAYTRINNDHLYEFVNAFNDKENGVLAKIQGILEETEYIKISDIFALLKSDNLMAEVEDKFINKKVINYAIDAIEQVIGIELVGILLPDLLEQMIYPMLPGNLNPVLDALYITSYEPNEIISDLLTVIEAVRIVINDTDLITYFYDGTFHLDEIAIENLDKIAPAFAKLSELYILKSANAAIAEAIILLNIDGLDIPSTRITEEALRHDLKDVLGNNDGIFKHILDVLYALNITRVSDLSTLSADSITYSEGLAEAIISVLDDVASLQLLNAILPDLASFGAVKLEQLGYEIKSLQQMTVQNLDGELARIVNLVRAIYETGAVTEYFKFGTVTLTQEKVNNIFDKVLELRFYNGLGDVMFEDVLTIVPKILNLEFDVKNVDTKDIDWYGDADLIKATIKPIAELLAQLNYSSYPSVTEFFKEIAEAPMDLLTRENVLLVIDVLDNIVKLESLSRVLPEGIRFGIEKYANQYEIGFLADIKPVEIRADLIEIMHALRDAVEFGALEFVNKGKLDGDLEIVKNKKHITEIFDHLSKLNILDNNSADILSIALNYLSKMLSTGEEFKPVEFENYSLSKDIKTIKLIVGLAVDLLDSVNLKTLKEISSFNVQDNLNALITDNNISLVADIIELLPEIQAFYHVLPFGARYAAKLMDILKPLEGKTPEQLQEDFTSISEIVRMIADYGVADAVLATLNGELYDFNTSIINLVRDIFEKVLFLNILDESEDTYLSKVLDMLGIDDSTVYYPDINWAADKTAILTIFDALKETLDSLEITHLSEAISIYENNEIMDKLVNNESLTGVVKVLDSLVNLTLVKELFFTVYNNKVLPMLGSLPTEFVDVNTIYSGNKDLLIQDLNSIVNVVRYAIELDAVGIYKGNQISYSSPAIGNIISTLFGLNYLNIDGQLETIVDYVLDKINMDLEIEDIDTINLKNDGIALANIYNKYFAPFLSDQDFMFKTINDFTNIQFTETLINDLIALLAKNNYAADLVEGLQDMVELSLGKVAIVAGVAFALDQITIDNPVYEALDIDSLTSAELISDIVDILEVAIIALRDFDAIGVYANGLDTFKLPTNGEELLRKIGYLIINLNILKEPTSDIIKAALDTYLPQLSTSNVNFDNVTIAVLADAIKEAFGVLYDLIEKLDIKDYNSAINYYTDNIATLLVIYDTVAMNGVIDIIDALLDNKAVAELLYAAYTSFAEEFVDPFGISIYSYENNALSLDDAKVTFLNDILSVVDVVKLAYNFAFGEEISYSDVESINQIVSKLVNLNILNDNIYGLIDYVNETFDLDINAGYIDLQFDGYAIVMFYDRIKTVFEDENWMFKKVENIVNFMNNPVFTEEEIKAIITNENVNAIIDSLECLINTTLVAAALDGANAKIRDLVPAEYQNIIDAIDLDSYLEIDSRIRTVMGALSPVVEDLNILLEIAKEAVEFGLVDYYQDADIKLIDNFENNSDHLKQMITDLFALNLLNNNSQKLIEAIFDLVGIEIPEGEYEYFKNASFEEEGELFADIIDHVYSIMTTIFGDEVYVSTIYNFIINQEYIVDGAFNFRLISQNVVKKFGKILEVLTQSVIITDAIIPAYNKFVYESLSDDLKGLASLENYNPNLLRNDIDAVVKIVKNAFTPKMVEYFNEFVYADHAVQMNYSARNFANVVEGILRLSIVEMKIADIIEYGYSLFDLELPYSKEEINNSFIISADAKAIGDLVFEIQKAFFKEGFYTYASDYRSFNYADFIYQALKQEVAVELVDSLRTIKDTTIINSLYVLGGNILRDFLVNSVNFDFGSLLEMTDLTDDRIADDYLAIIDILKYAVQTYGAENLYAHILTDLGLIEIDKIVDIVKYTLNKVVTLNLFNIKDDSLSRMIEVTINTFAGTNLYLDLKDVNYVDEIAIINSAIDSIFNGVKESIGTNVTYRDLINWINNANFIDESMYENGLTAVEKLLSLKTLERVVLPVYAMYQADIEEMLGDYAYLADLRYETGNELLTDVRAIVTALIALKAINPVGIYLDYAQGTSNTTIKYNDTSIGNLIKVLLETKYVERHETELIITLFDMVESANIELSYTEEEVASMLDLAADASTIGTFVTNILTAYFTEGFYQYGSDYRSIDVNEFVEQIKDNTVAVNVVNALETIKDTTLINVVYRLGINYGGSLLADMVDPEFEELVNASTLSKVQVSEDYTTVLSIVRNVINKYGIDNIINHMSDINSVDVYKAIEVVEDTLEKLVSLNVLEYTLPRMVEVLLNKYVGTTLSGELAGVKYDEEIVIINETIELVKTTLQTLIGENIVFGDIVDWFNDAQYINNTVYENGLTAVEKLLTLTTIERVALNVYDVYKEDVRNILPKTNTGFADLDYENSKEFVEDIKPLITSLKGLVAIDPTGIYLDYANDTDKVEINYNHPAIIKVLETLFSRKYLASHKDDIAVLIHDSIYAIEYTTEEEIIATLDLAADAENLAKSITAVLEVVLGYEFNYANAYITFDPNVIISTLLSDKVVKEVVTAIQTNKFTSTTVAEIAYIIGVEILRKEVISKELGNRFEKYFLTDDLTSAQIKADLDALLDLVIVATNNNAVKYVNSNFNLDEIKVVNVANMASEALTTITSLNLVKDSLSDFVVEYLSAAEITDDIDLSDINLAGEINIVAATLQDVAYKLVDNNIIYISDIMNVDRVLLIPAAIVALDGIIDLAILDKLAIPVANYLRDTYVTDEHSFIGQMTDVNFYNDLEDATLLGDIRTIVKKVIDVYETKLEDYLSNFNNDTKLDYVLLADAFSEIYATIVSTAYAANKEENIIQLVMDLMQIDDSILPIANITDRFDFATDTTVIRNTLMYAAQNILAKPSFIYTTINEWKELNISNLIIHLTDNGTIDHTINVIKALVGTTNASTISEVAYVLGLAYAKQMLDNDYSDYTDIIRFADLTNAEVKADLDVIINILETIADNKLNTNVEAAIRQEFDYRDLVVSDLYPVLEVLVEAVLGTETTKNLNAIKDELGTTLTKALREYANITTDLADVNVKHETTIILEIAKLVIDLGTTNSLTTIGNYLNMTNNLDAYATDANVYDLAAIIDKALTLEIVEKHGLDLYNELVFDKVTDETLAKYINLSEIYLVNENLINDVKVVLSVVRELTDTSKFTYGLVTYAKDAYENTTTVRLSDEFVSALAPAITTLMKLQVSENAINMLLEDIAERLEINASEMYITLKADANDLTELVEVLVDIVMSDVEFASELREMTLSSQIDKAVKDNNITLISEAIDTAAETSLVRIAYEMGLTYVYNKREEIVNGVLADAIEKDLTDAEKTEDVKVITKILRVIDTLDVRELVKVVRKETSYKDLKVRELYPVLEVLVEAVLGTETTKNLNAIKDELGTTLTKALREYANITTDLADVNVAHETTILLEIVDALIDLGATNEIITIGNYIYSINNYKEYVTDANVYDLAAIIEKALTLEIVEKHGLDLYYELVYNELLSGTEIAKYADVALIYVDNNEFISDVKALLAIVRNLTDLSKFTYGLVTYAKDVYSNVDRYELSDEFITALTPAIVAVLKTVIAKYDANVLVNEITNKYSLTSDVTLDVNNDADELSTLIEVLVDIVMSDMTYVSGLRNLTVTSLGSKMITNHNLTRVADAIDTAAETSVVRMAYDLALAYADRKADTVAGGRFNNVIATDLTVNEMTEDVKTLTAILRTLDSVDVESDLRAIRNGTIGVTDVNLVKYQPSISTILDKVAALHAINDMTELVVNVLDYVKVIDVTDEIRSALSTINYRDEFVVLSDAAEVFIPNMAVAFGDATTLTARQVIDYIKAYRTFDNDFATFEKVVDVIIDTLEVLEDSQILKGIAIAAYNKLIANNGSLPATVRDILSLDPSYTSDNFMNDYSKVLTIVKSVVNAKMYKVIYNRHLTAFEVLDNLDDELANIIKAVSTLDFLTINNNSKVVDIISIIASRVGVLSSLDQTKDQFATIDLPAEGLIFASMTTDMVKAFKVMQNYGRNIDLPILGETELIKSIVNIFGTYLTSETHNIVTRVLMNALVTSRIYSLTEKLGRPQEAFADDLTNEEVDDLCNDVKAVLELLIEAGVFTNGTINLTDATGNATNEKLVTAYEIINGHLTLSAKVERVLNAIVHRAYIVGSIDIDYSVMSLSNEQSAISDLVSPAVAIARDIMNAINSRDFDLAVSLTMENRINTLYVNAMYSEILHQLALPVINIILAGALTDKYAFLVFDENDGVTIDNIMDEIDLLFCAAREIVSVIDYSSGSLDFVFENFDNINNGIDLLISMKSVNGGTTDNLEEIFRYAIEKVLKVTLSDDVVAIDEVEIIKTIISKINPLVQTGAYDNKKITKAILSRTALYIVASIIDDIHDSVMLYEIKDQLIDKVSRIIPASVRDKVINLIKNTDAETLKADTLILSETLRFAAQANIYQNGEITIETKEQFNYIADAYEKAFTMSSIASRSEKLYEEVFKRIDLSSIDTNLDPIANVNKAIANEGWSWAKETEAIADLIRSLGDVTESGTKVVSGTKLNLNSIMDCTDPTALASVLKAINNSSLFRVLLPEMILSTADTLGTGDYVSQWLRNEKVSMSEKSVWETENAKLAKVIAIINSSDINFSDFNSSSTLVEDATLFTAKKVLLVINDSKSFVIDPIVSVMNTVVNKVDGVSGIELDANNVTNWETELDILFGTFDESANIDKKGVYSLTRDLGTIDDSDDSLTKVGTLLDKMVESDLLYPALTDIFTGAISNTSLYESEEEDTLKINYHTTTITAVNARIKDELTSISNPDERWSWTKEINNMKQIKKSIDDYNNGTITIINVAQDINSVINNVKVSDGNGGYKPSLILEVSEDLFEQVKQIASNNYGINIEEYL